VSQGASDNGTVNTRQPQAGEAFHQRRQAPVDRPMPKSRDGRAIEEARPIHNIGPVFEDRAWAEVALSVIGGNTGKSSAKAKGQVADTTAR